jgi:hypothetical protein
MGNKKLNMASASCSLGISEPCEENNTTACLTPFPRTDLSDDRFKVRVNWRTNFGSPRRQAVVTERGDDFAALRFAPRNTEIEVAVENRCGDPNFGSYWVFVSPVNDNIEYQLTVSDSLTGAEESYFKAANQATPPITDTAAFDTCP